VFVVLALAIVGGYLSSHLADDEERRTATTGAASRVTTTTATSGVSIELVLGHCEIERVVLNDQTWLPTGSALGIGSGGGRPSSFTGSGTFFVTSDMEAAFHDDGGLVLPFLRKDHSADFPRWCI
jgi:hypothetical protein